MILSRIIPRARRAFLCLSAFCMAWPVEAAPSAGAAAALKDTLALTPPMGWNSWNHFGGGLTEAKFKAIADAFVSEGLRDAGYKYLVIDDAWMEAKRDADSGLVTVTSKFPSGIKSLGDYVHGKGLKLGIYACPTRTTCQRRAGSFNHEAQDARLFASWGVDFLKYDWCGVQSGEDAEGLSVAEVQRRFAAMRNALRASGRPIVYSLSEKTQGTRGVVAGSWSDTVGHMWRIGGDIHDTWASVAAHADQNAGLSKYSGPGGWNDPDMLEVGNGGLTDAENRLHFSFWCIQAAPLILGNDPSAMTSAVKAILTNKEAIAVDQDSLGVQGQRIAGKGTLEVWVKALKNGEKAVLLANLTDAEASISVKWNDSLIRWGADASVDVRDLWAHQDHAAVASGWTAKVPSHDGVLIRLHNRKAASARSPKPGSILLAGAAQGGFRLFLPPGMQAGPAELTDARGRGLARMELRPGWNALPLDRLPRGLCFLRLGGTDALLVIRPFPG
jgi:alpha-galactosidase